MGSSTRAEKNSMCLGKRNYGIMSYTAMGLTLGEASSKWTYEAFILRLCQGFSEIIFDNPEFRRLAPISLQRKMLISSESYNICRNRTEHVIFERSFFKHESSIMLTTQATPRLKSSSTTLSKWPNDTGSHFGSRRRIWEYGANAIQRRIRDF